MKKINQKGGSHYLLPLVVAAAIALVGVKVLTSSHADQIALTTTTTATIGNHIAVLDPSNASGGTAAQSSVPYTLMGYKTVNFLAPGEALTYNSGIKGNEQSCFYVYVSQPKSGTATVTVEVANNNNTKTVNISSTTTDDLRQICVAPGTGVNPGFSIKNLTSPTQTNNIEVLSETIHW